MLVANAAAQLALDVDRCQDLLHARQIDGQPLAGAFQIDDVQVLGALLGELPGDGGRVLGEDGLLLVVALPQADALATAKIDRRPDLHGQFVPSEASADEPGRFEERRNTKYATAAGAWQGAGAVGDDAQVLSTE